MMFSWFRRASNESAPPPVLEQRLHQLIEAQRIDQITPIIANYSPFEVAMACYRLSTAEVKLILITVLPPARAALVFRELEGPYVEKLASYIESSRLAIIISQMALDDAADCIEQLPWPKRVQTFGRLPDEFKKALEPLLQYAPNKAGGLMDPHVLSVQPQSTVEAAIVSIRRYVEQHNLTNFYAVYVVDAEQRLLGMLPVSKLLVAEKNTLISNIADFQVETALEDIDEADIVRQFREHDLVVLPVVNHNGVLLGRITVDDVVEMITRQHDEDLAYLSGTAAQPGMHVSLWRTFIQRLPWLFVALLGEFSLAVVLQNHESVIERFPSVALFIALILAMGGNTGIQSTTLIVRGLASGEIRWGEYGSKIMREGLLSIGLGGVFGILLVGGGWLLTKDIQIGLAVGIATLFNIMVSMLIGGTIPLMLKRLGIDPAVASGPFLTTANDILGMIIYLLVIYWIMF